MKLFSGWKCCGAKISGLDDFLTLKKTFARVERSDGKVKDIAFGLTNRVRISVAQLRFNSNREFGNQHIASLDQDKKKIGSDRMKIAVHFRASRSLCNTTNYYKTIAGGPKALLSQGLTLITGR